MDEITLLGMCKDVEFCSFKERDSDSMTIEIEGTVETYKILRTIEFTSARKMMSVIAQRDSDNKIFSFVKGADMAILPAMT